MVARAWLNAARAWPWSARIRTREVREGARASVGGRLKRCTLRREKVALAVRGDHDARRVQNDVLHMVGPVAEGREDVGDYGHVVRRSGAREARLRRRGAGAARRSTRVRDPRLSPGRGAQAVPLRKEDEVGAGSRAHANSLLKEAKVAAEEVGAVAPWV